MEKQLHSISAFPLHKSRKEIIFVRKIANKNCPPHQVVIIDEIHLSSGTLICTSVSPVPGTLPSTQQALNKQLMNEKKACFEGLCFLISRKFTCVPYHGFQQFTEQKSLWKTYQLGRQGLPSQRIVLDQ